jgi:NAD(P)H-hydrate repair Nnr-like enzyme with NAD(P)H-hydrate dehydratase domain
MARLLECEPEEVEIDPLAAARRAVERYRTVALVKGRYSFIAAPDGRAFRFEGGGIGLATSGSGDVLAGIVGGLAARGADPLTATLWGVWLHGEAGRILTHKVGRVGFLAREIADLVPRLLDPV